MFSLVDNRGTSLTIEALDKLNQYGLKIDELFIAICLYNSWGELLDRYFGKKNFDQKSVLMQPLVRKHIIDEYKENYSEIRFTMDGARYIAEISMSMQHGETPKIVLKTETPVDEFDKFVIQFLSIFPKGVKNAGQVTIRSNFTDTKEKLQKFLKKYKFDQQTVLKATTSFVAKFRGNYAYCPAAMYFIIKDNRSMLATECESIEEGGEEAVSNAFNELM